MSENNPTWRPDQYLLFEEERTRPCRDLVSQIRGSSARTIIDLGCGPGNSTAVLGQRWPEAKITGLDSSGEMLERARHSYPQYEWVEGDIATWPDGGRNEYDIVFSNAALQWVRDHAAVYPKLFARVSPGGVLAIQVPANIAAPAHRIMRDMANSPTWRARFPSGGVREWFVHDAAFYYDLLAPTAKAVNLWETTYVHVMPNPDSIAEWYKGTGLRPFLSKLRNDEHREAFVNDYTAAIRSEFKPAADGNVLLPFHRLFLIAKR